MAAPSLAAFVVIAGAFVVSPGADTMLVIRSVIANGRRAGVLTACGIGAGCVVHAALSAVGVSAALQHSACAYDAVKVAGALYLVWLGLQALHTAVRPPAADRLDGGSRAPTAAFRDGFLTNLLNPKVALFYLAFLPQFIDTSSSVVESYAALAGIHIALGVGWFSLVSLALDRVRPWLTSRRTRRWLDAALAMILIGLGVRLAMTHAPA
jgi:RhtB (resistance to homoserine/threonine) family protein